MHGCVHESVVEKAYELFIPESKRSEKRAIMFDQFHKNANETLKSKQKESEKGCIKREAHNKMCVLYPHFYKIEKAASRDDAEEENDEDLSAEYMEESALLVDNAEAFNFGNVPNRNLSPVREAASHGLIALKRRQVFSIYSFLKYIRFLT